MNNHSVSVLVAVIGIPIILVAWSIAVHNVRVWRVRKLARTLPVGTRERILSRIAEAARGSSVCTLLVQAKFPNDESTDAHAIPAGITASRFGGSPYGEVGEQWPTRDDTSAGPAEFLIQVRLDESLPEPWPGRLIVVFQKFDVAQTVFVYAAPSSEKYALRPGSPNAGSECRLMPLPIPKTDPPLIPPSVEHVSTSELPNERPDFEEHWQLPYDPTLLLKSVPGLREDLRQFTSRPVDLLTHLMLTERHGYELDVSDIVQLGGRPQWIQFDPGPTTCPICGNSMRFLFQFGDLSGQSRLGDAGVCFVFGCDTHPDSIQSLVQMC